MKKCPKCGKETDCNFCPDCGFNLSEINDSEHTDDPVKIIEAEEKEPASDSVMAEEPGEVHAEDGEERESSGEQEGEDTGTDEVTESPTSETVLDENAVAVPVPNDEFQKGKKKKTGLIVGGIIAAVVLIAIVVISSIPKLVSIDAKYNGPTKKGTVINNDSNITVTGTYDNDTKKEITGWSVGETTIRPGFNDIKVTYEDQTASISVYSPLMSGGQYIASVDEIKSVLSGNNYAHVDGFSGFSKDSEVGGKYNYDGTDIEMSVSFTKRSGSENVDVDGSEIPNAVIVTTISRSADFGDNLDRLLSAGAAAFTTVDPSVNFDDAYTQIKQCTADAVDKAEGAMATDDKSLDNLDIGTGMILANGKLLLFYSFKSK